MPRPSARSTSSFCALSWSVRCNSNPQNATELADAMSIVEVLARHGGAFYVCAAANPGGDHPKFAGGLICDAGDEADNLDKWLHELSASPDEHKPTITRAGSVLRIEMGEMPGGPAGLKEAPHFTSAMRQVDANPMFIAYLDFERANEVLEHSAAHDPDARKFAAIKSVLGLNGLKRFVMTGALDGQDFQARTFIDAPPPRTGLLALWDQGAVDPALLARVPADVTVVQTAHFNVPSLYKTVRQATAQGSTQAVQNFDKAAGLLHMYLGCDPISGLLDPLGSNWVMYQRPAKPGEKEMLGTVLVAKLNNPTQAAQGLRSMSYALANLSQNPKLRVPVRFTVQEQTLGGLSVTTLSGAPSSSPSWTMHDGFLYVAATAERAAAAAEYAGPGFAQSPRFAAIQQQLPPSQKLRSFDYIDLEATGPATYKGLRTVADMMLGIGAARGLKLPPNPLPPLEKLKPELGSIVSVSWTDAEGMHAKTRTPFPGASLMSTSGLGEVGVASLMVSVLLPSLNRARETANRVKCASNERQIGQALLMYSNEHNGQYPPDLGTLTKTEDISAEVFVCPSGNTSVPAGLKAKGPDAIADWVNNNSDYVYITGKTNEASANDVIVYEKPGDHGRDGMNILYGDGHVEWKLMPAAVHELERCNIAVPPEMRQLR